jgi:hypothetical protein
MTYILYSDKGYVQDLSSVVGMQNMYTFIHRVKLGGALANFIAKGTTNDISQTIAEIDSIIPDATDMNVRMSLQKLRDGLKKVKGTAIISE